MSIQKKSLISTLKTTKKANVASTPSDAAVKGDKAVRMAAAGRNINRTAAAGRNINRTAAAGRNINRTAGGRHHNE